MSADDGIYIGYWVINGTKVYAVANTQCIDNLAFYKDGGNWEDYEKYVNDTWSGSDLFLTHAEAEDAAYHMERKDFTEYGVNSVGKFCSAAPEHVADWVWHRVGSGCSPKKSVEPPPPLAACNKFWLIYNPASALPPITRYSSRELAEKESRRLAVANAGSTFIVLEAVGEAKLEAMFKRL